MPAMIELEGAKAVKALAAAKAEGVKIGAASAKAAAAKTTVAKVAATKGASGIFSGGASACHLGLGLGLGAWGPVLLVVALCAGTGACVYWRTKRKKVEQIC